MTPPRSGSWMSKYYDDWPMHYSVNIRPEYLELLLHGTKTIEVRVAYPRFAQLDAGDTLIFNGQHRFDVIKVDRFASFDDMLRDVDGRQIYPTDPKALPILLRQIYPPEKEALGVLAIHVRAAA
jgi:ASC-1-like (ASCH) protein